MMQKALMLAAVVGPFYLIMGLSLMLYVKQWQKLVADFAKNHFAVLPMMFMSLILGLLLIRYYNVWEWSTFVVITLTGWIAFIKGAFYLLAPEAWIKGIMKCKLLKNDNYFYFWGAVMTILGVMLSYNAFFI